MRFGTKLILCIIAIMACILSCSRYFIIRQNFIHNMEKSASQNLNHHMSQRYYLESNIIGNIKHGEEITDKDIIENIESLYSYLGDSKEMLVLYDDKQNMIFSNFNDIDKTKINIIPNNEADSYYVGRAENRYYMFFPSYLAINNKVLYVINIYDVTDIYEERQRQLKDVAFSDIIILSVASIFIAIFSKFLTEPIKNLNDNAKRISKGEFSNRVNIKSDDEIGELANSFNIMSEEIENKINSLNLSIKQKDDFINAFTHEIKTPMTAIIGYSSMLRLKKCDEEFSRKSLNYIYSEAKRLEVLSHKLMSLMSLSEERLEIRNY